MTSKHSVNSWVRPAKHMLEWHAELCTGEDGSVLGIGGPNTAILAPRGSAKSTVLGLFAAWMIGRHTAAKKMLRILYIAYMVDISRAKSATIKGILTSSSIMKSSRWLDCQRLNEAMNTGVLTMNLRGLTQQVKKLSPLHVVVSRAITSSALSSFLSMTLLNPLRQSTILTLA